MITQREKDAIVEYLEFLLVKQYLEPIIDKHVTDPDVIEASYDAMYGILQELERSIEEHREDNSITVANIVKKS